MELSEVGYLFNAGKRIGEIAVAHDLDYIQVGLSVVSEMRLHAGFSHGFVAGEMEPESHRDMVDFLAVHCVEDSGAFIHSIFLLAS